MWLGNHRRTDVKNLRFVLGANALPLATLSNISTAFADLSLIERRLIAAGFIASFAFGTGKQWTLWTLAWCSAGIWHRCGVSAAGPFDFKTELAV